SVASRLARARALLARRLAQRGFVLTGSVTAASAPPALVASTIRAASLLAAGRAAGVVSTRVAALAEGVVNAMPLTNIKIATIGGRGTAALAGAAGRTARTQATGQPQAKEGPPTAGTDQKPCGEKQPMTKEERLRVLIDRVLAAHGGEDRLRKLRFTMT